MISLSMRLFGNILSGSILMYLVYQLTGYISGLLINFNFLGPVIAPWLHCILMSLQDAFKHWYSLHYHLS